MKMIQRVSRSDSPTGVLYLTDHEILPSSSPFVDAFFELSLPAVSGVLRSSGSALETPMSIRTLSHLAIPPTELRTYRLHFLNRQASVQ